MDNSLAIQSKQTNHHDYIDQYLTIHGIDDLIAKDLPPKIYIEYKYRFIICILYAFSILMNGIMWVTCSPITTNLQSIYGVSEFQVTLSSMVFLILYFPMNFPSNYILDEYGLKTGILLGNFFTLAGAWTRVLCETNFYFILLGQLLTAIGQPLILGATPKVSAVWFKPDNRTITTSTLSLTGSIGVGIGFFIPQFFVGNNDTANGLTHPIYNLMLAEALIVTISLVPTFFLFQNKPPTPPSYSAYVEKTHFWESFNAAKNNKNFLSLCIMVGFCIGVLNTISTIIQPLIFPFGFTQEESSDLGTMILLSGIISCIILGIYVEKTKKFRSTLIMCVLLSLIGLIIFTAVLTTNNFWLLSFGTLLFGFFLVPILPLGMEFACELTFPAGEAIISGTLVCSTQVIAVLQILFCDTISQENNEFSTYACLIIMFISLILGLIAILNVEEKLQRRIQDLNFGIVEEIDNIKSFSDSLIHAKQ